MNERIELQIRLKKLLIERVYESLLVVFIFGSIVGYAFCMRVDKCEQSREDRIEAVDNVDPDVNVSGKIEVSEPIVTDPDRSSGLENDISPVSVCADVGGAINRPGVYCLAQGSMMIDMVKEAGGFSSSVAGSYVARILNLSQQVKANSKIYIPYEDEVRCDLLEITLKNLRTDEIIPNIVSNEERTETPTEQSSGEIPDVVDPSDPPSACIDLNSASIEELVTIDGIGESTAQKIIDARPFVAVEGLLDVSGIGDAKYAQMKDSFCPI